MICLCKEISGGEKLVDTEKLRVLRCSKAYFDAADFARAIGMKPENYRNRERGKVKFSTDEVLKICEVLGVSLEEVLGILI